MKKTSFLGIALLFVLAAVSCKKEEEGPLTSITYQGETYKVVQLADGKYWMAENLRYVPEGVTVSDDVNKITGMWYPVTTDGTDMSFDKSAVAKAGYLYSADVAFGKAVTADNFDKFAKVRGICPEGWHIPDFDDWFGLVGHTSNSKVIPDNEAAPYYDADLKGFGSIAKAAADGLVIPVTGAVTVANAAAAKGTIGGAVGKAPDKKMNFEYILGSSSFKKFEDKEGNFTNAQYYSVVTNRANGTLIVGYSGYRFGCAVRCVKDE